MDGSCRGLINAFYLAFFQDQNRGRVMPEIKWLGTTMTICALVLISGVLVMKALALFKTDSGKTAYTAPPLAVSVVRVKKENVPVTLTGYGPVKAVNILSVSSQMDGRLVFVNPKIEPGQILLQGELLFQVDDTKLKIRKKELVAKANVLENEIEQIRIRHKWDLERYLAAKRNQDLCRGEFLRIKALFLDHGVGSSFRVDQAEIKLNHARESALGLNQAVKAFPHALDKARSSLVQVQAQLESVQEDMSRCGAHAPFGGRVKTASIEPGQVVTAGQELFTLADDSLLEIEIALNGDECRQWLLFEDKDKGLSSFKEIKRVNCRIYTLGEANREFIKGELHRFVRVNNKTRAIILAVRIRSDPDSFFLVEGMFCRVEVPGRTMKNVVRLPSQAVSFDGNLYIADKNRLKTVPVDILRIQGDQAFIKTWLDNGQSIIVSKLANPVENTLLTIIPD